MRIGFFSESPADQAALAVLVEGIVSAAPERINMDLEGHGVAAVLGSLDGVFRGVHYNSDAEGLIIVVDSDDTVMHEPGHDVQRPEAAGCRFCQIRRIVECAQNQLRARKDRPALKVAVGLAVPCIEAWYLVGKNHQVGEAAWKVGMTSGQPPFTKQQLKNIVYGTDRPSLEHETECAVREARRIIAGGVAAVEAAFPAGFGLMAQAIRSWAAI